MKSRLRKYFISGLIIFLPLALTINLLILTFNVADGWLGRYIEPYFSREFGFYFRGISILICILFILLIGFFASNFLGRRLVPFFEGLLLRIPVFKQIYPAFKEMSMFIFSAHEKLSYQRVVLVEYPRKGLFSYGFLTSDAHEKISKVASAELCYVLIPTTPTPLSGFTILVPKRELIYPDITIEEALKIIVSGGIVNNNK